MNKLKSLMVVALACFVMSSCNNNESKIDDFRNLQEQVAEDSEDWTAEEWSEFLDEYNELVSSISSSDLTEEEKDEFNQIKRKCRKYVIKGRTRVTIGTVGDALSGAGEAISNAWNDAFEDNDEWDDIKDAMGETREALEDAFDDVFDDARDAVDDALNDALESVGDKVEDALGSATDAVKDFFNGLIGQ